MFRHFPALTAVACVLLALGCNRGSAISTRSLGTGSISHNDTTAWFVIDDGKIPVVVVADSVTSSSGSSGDAAVTGTLNGHDAKPVSLDYRANDGTISIDGVKYGLANGSVFLVSTAESPRKVVQLPHAPLVASDPTRAVLDLERDDPQVHAFISHTTPTTAPGAALP